MSVDLVMGKLLLANREARRGTKINNEWLKAQERLEHWLCVNGPQMIMDADIPNGEPGGCRASSSSGMVCIRPSNHDGLHDWLVL